ncbi:hypothetical protein VH571_13165 [Frondihabitans sp. 4ASC-45]|uniref:hypothetical protein n=1 Tax=Frondihabitans sp. 4ASC-45 TaxID=3111636 RepID=UPI003C13B082
MDLKSCGVGDIDEDGGGRGGKGNWGKDRGHRCSTVGTGGEPTFRSRVSGGHFDSLIDDRVSRDAGVFCREPVRVDLVRVGVQSVREQFAEPVAGGDILSVEGPDKRAELLSVSPHLLVFVVSLGGWFRVHLQGLVLLVGLTH